MLQNDQISNAQLLTALLEAYYPAILSLETCLLEDQAHTDGEKGQFIRAEAAQATRLTFNAAVMGRYTFRGEISLRVWLFRLALEKASLASQSPSIWQTPARLLQKILHPSQDQSPAPPPSEGSVMDKIWRLPREARQVVYLRYLSDLELPEIASILSENENRLLERLETAWRGVIHVPGIDPSPDSDGPHIEMRYKIRRMAVESTISSYEAQMSRQKVTQHLKNCPVCQAYAGALSQAGSEMDNALKERYSGKSNYAEELSRLQNQVENLVTSQEKRKGAFARWRDLGLGIGVVLLIFVALFTVAQNPADRVKPTPKTVIHTVVVTPTRAPTAVAQYQPDHYYTYRVKQGETLKAIASLARTDADLIISLNHLDASVPLKDGQLLVLPPPLGGTLVAGSTLINPNLPVPTLVPTLIPQESSSEFASGEELWQRIQAASKIWSTVWADITIKNYGPLGYAGPPVSILHGQVWISQPGQSLETISVSSWTTPTMMRFFKQGTVTWVDPYSSTPDLTEHSADLIDMPYLQALFFPEKYLPRNVSTPVLMGSFTRDERPGIIISLLEANQQAIHLWMDEATGVLLGVQLFGGPDQQTLLAEAQVNRININADFPQDIYDPLAYWPREFARDQTGLPLENGAASLSLEDTLPGKGHNFFGAQPLPANYDPSNFPLTFQWPATVSLSGTLTTSTGVISTTDVLTDGIDLYAGPYRLAHLQIGKVSAPNDTTGARLLGFQPLFLPSDTGSRLGEYLSMQSMNFTCRRSADGRRIVFSVQEPPSPSTSTLASQLYWLDLFNPDQLHSLPDGSYPFGSFAISPDGQQIVYLNNQGINVVQWDGQNSRQLAPLFRGGDLTWSPDGKKLALIAMPSRAPDLELWVLDATTGYAEYKETVHLYDLQIPGDSPTYSWNVNFPTGLQVLKSIVDGNQWGNDYSSIQECSAGR